MSEVERGEQTTRSCPSGNAIKVSGARTTHSVLEDVSSLTERYVVLETIGRGGMGTVVRAFDSKLRREVALKLLRAGTLGGEAQARMIREAQAMAQLSHPNVVAVYDVCLDGSTVAIAMEYIAGEPLNEWLQRRKRAWGDIVARFMEAGRGLEAAHAIGLIHRDFKPTNVLVGDDHRVRVSDFGLAKASDQEVPEPVIGPTPREDWDPLTVSLTHTDVVVGTPRYMAPEQHSRVALDARTDQYAYCVALWEALNGHSPFRGPELANAKHDGPPPWENSAVPRHIVRAIERGLAPKPDDRWPSMSALLHELSRSPRWRSIAVTSSAAVLAVVGTSAWVSFEEPSRCAVEAEQLTKVWDSGAQDVVTASFMATERSYAKAAATDVTNRLDVYVAEWTAESRALCIATDATREHSEALAYRTQCLRRARDEVTAAVDVLRTADETVVQRATALLRALPNPSDCGMSGEALASFAAPTSPVLVPAVAQARKTLATASSLFRVGKIQAAHELLTETDLAVAQQHPPIQIERSMLLGSILRELGRYDEAEAALHVSMDLAIKESLVFDATVAANRLSTLLGSVGGRPDEGVQVARIGLALALSVDEGGAFEARARKALSDVLRHAGNNEESERELRAAFAVVEAGETLIPKEHADLHISMAFLLEDAGRMSEAEEHQRKSLDILIASSPPGHPNVGIAQHNFAQILRRLDRLEEAETTARSAVDILEKALGEAHTTTLIGRENLAAILMSQKRHEEARTLFEANVKGFEKALGPKHPQVAAAATNLGMVLFKLGDYAAAELQHRRAERMWIAAMGNDNPRLAVILDNLADAVSTQGRHAEAGALYARALELRERTLGPEHADIATTLHRWAMQLSQAEQYKVAEEKLSRAWTIVQTADIGPRRKAEVAFLLAQVRHELDPDDPTIDEIVQAATNAFDAAGPSALPDLERLQAWVEHDR